MASPEMTDLPDPDRGPSPLHEFLLEEGVPDADARFAERNCAGMDRDRFFAITSKEIRDVAKICVGCVIQPECLDFARIYGERGVWGGTSERKRDKMPLHPRYEGRRNSRI